MASRSNGKPLPASAPDPSGITLARRRASPNARNRARHFEIRQQVVRPQDGLRAPHMRVAGNHGIGILRRQIEQRRITPASSSRSPVAFLAQPEPRIERDLFVAAAAGVDLVRHRAGPLLQLADDQRVDVFIGRAT